MITKNEKTICINPIFIIGNVAQLPKIGEKKIALNIESVYMGKCDRPVKNVFPKKIVMLKGLPAKIFRNLKKDSHIYLKGFYEFSVLKHAICEINTSSVMFLDENQKRKYQSFNASPVSIIIEI